MKENFSLTVESRHKIGIMDEENIHRLEGKTLAKRDILTINIATDSVDSKDYKADEDPKLVKSVKTGRGPLTDDWLVRNHSCHTS